MKARWAASFVLLGAALAVAADRPQSRAAAERDLSLELALRGPAVIQPGQAIDLGLTLRNGSGDAAYRIVMPGDGSGWDWREPHVWITAETERLHDDWTPLAARAVSRCKQFDRDWLDEVRELAAGESVTLDGSWAPVHQSFDLQQAGRVRLRAHYAYRGRAVDEKGHGDLAGVAPFTLVSEPVIVTVERPLEIETVFRRTLPATERVRVAELCRAFVINQSDEPVTLDPAAWRLSLRWTVNGDHGEATVVGAPGRSRDPVTLAPGETVPLFGEKGLAAAPEVTLAAPAEAEVEMWAEIWSMQAGGPRIRSERSRPRIAAPKRESR